MKRIYLLLSFLLIYISSFGQALTIISSESKQTYSINGTSTGDVLIASEVNDTTIRLYNSTHKSSSDYRTVSVFSDFLINGVVPTDVSDAVDLINRATKRATNDVVIQDSTSPLIIIKASQLIAETTTSVLAVEDEYTFTVTSATGALVGHQFSVYSVIDNRYSVFTVLAINALVITVDSPIDFPYKIGSFVQFGNTNMAVDGSVTPVIFGVRNTFGQDIDISLDFTRIVLSMQTTTLGNLSLFGNIPKLTKGLVCRFVDGRNQNIFNIKDNREMDNIMFDFKFIPTQGGAPDGLSGRFTFTKLGAVIRLRPFEDLQFIVQDDYTVGGITIFEIVAQGAGVVN